MIFTLLVAAVVPVPAQKGLTTEEILKKIGRLSPDAEDFVFEPPDGWSANLTDGASIAATSAKESAEAAWKLIDRQPYTTWQSQALIPNPEITIDLGADKTFDRVVMFNRHTESRGTAGGNNAARRVEILVDDTPGDGFRSLATFSLAGPREVCFKKREGGQICTFIDRSSPNVLELPRTSCRRLKLRVLEAYWNEDADAAWRTSVALSELMLFDSHGRGDAPKEGS